MNREGVLSVILIVSIIVLLIILIPFTICKQLPDPKYKFMNLMCYNNKFKYIKSVSGRIKLTEKGNGFVSCSDNSSKQLLILDLDDQEFTIIINQKNGKCYMSSSDFYSICIIDDKKKISGSGKFVYNKREYSLELVNASFERGILIITGVGRNRVRYTLTINFE